MAQEKILIVDDEVVVAEDIRRQLRSLGYVVVGVVASGSEAVHQAGEHRPDLILMDIKLKGPLDGIDTARTIQSRYGIPVIYLTAFSDEDTLERARHTLPLAYLIKPFVSSDLRAALELALFRQRVLRIAEQRGRWLDSVVQSMKDAVVTVDPQGKVTLLNPAAEELTGWSQPDALGKAIQEVMVFVDAQRRTPLTNPALSALQQITASDQGRRPVLLISRQGLEHLISESATVIQDERGEPAGAVLVFRPATA
ncbi:MAG: Putative Response regulator [Nitrospira sp.]|nr:MAG: Putative Response regulator [Nitrospira sp.]